MYVRNTDIFSFKNRFTALNGVFLYAQQYFTANHHTRQIWNIRIRDFLGSNVLTSAHHANAVGDFHNLE